jgi:hypothetical protein
LTRAVAVAASATVVLAGCGDGDDGSRRDALAERVVAVLEADGGAVDGNLDGADVTCPAVDDPAPGDRATCTVGLDGDRSVQVDIEFEADGSIAVVAVVPG